MRLGIDASNIRAGGTVTHLVELLRAADPVKHGFHEVIVWASSSILNKIDDRPWLRKESDRLLEQSNDPFIDRRHLYRAAWQRLKLFKLLQKNTCNLLFVPGGLDTSGFQPMVTLCQNMLPFEVDESRRYGLSLARLRLSVLRLLQARTFRRADGLILLSRYARDVVLRVSGVRESRTTVIAHGINSTFFCAPRAPRAIDACTSDNPFRVIYVSTIDMYKHQWCVAEAIAQLRSRGRPLVLDLVGPAYPSGLRRLKEKLNELAGSSEWVRYHGSVPYEGLHEMYARSDLKIFASSCENLPIILLEAMASGLPIACSHKGPMREILGDAGVYFNPESATEIASAVDVLISSVELRLKNSIAAFDMARNYSWQRCAHETFTFLAECTRSHVGGQVSSA